MLGKDEQGSSPNKGIRIGLIVVLLGAAGFIAYRQRPAKLEQLDTAETATTYVCVECGHGMDLTAAQYAKMSAEQAGQRGRVGELRGYSFLQCPQCKKSAVIMGGRCPKDGTPIPQRTKDGKPGRCQKCGYALMGE